jgi:hypothetical protein
MLGTSEAQQQNMIAFLKAQVKILHAKGQLGPKGYERHCPNESLEALGL